MKADEFASLLCSRLCHDMISPVGAITNALELLEEDIDQETEAQVMALLKQSAEQTSRKLQFFRLAFGAAGGFAETLDLREAQRAAGGLLDSYRVEPLWSMAADTASKSMMKLLLCLILIAAETMVRGGKLAISCDADPDGKMTGATLVAAGSRLVIAPGIENTLLGKVSATEPQPKTAPAQLAALVAKDLKAHITLETGQIEADNPQVVFKIAV